MASFVSHRDTRDSSRECPRENDFTEEYKNVRPKRKVSAACGLIDRAS